MLFSRGFKVISHMALTVQGQKMTGHKAKITASRMHTYGAAYASRATAIEMNDHANGKQISW